MNDHTQSNSPEQTLTRAQRRALPIELTPPQHALAEEIITELEEYEPSAQQQLRALIRHDSELVREVLLETRQVMEGGGIAVKSGKRSRTPGGVFFYLISQRLTPEQRRETLQLYHVKKKNPARAASQKASKAKGIPWDLYTRHLSTLKSVVGKASNVKISLTGRPGKVRIVGDTVMTMVEHTVKSASLPKGVPTPPRTPTTYTVYIGVKQWRRIADALNDPDDVLIVEGVCAYDPEQQGMVVFATSALSKMQEVAKREAKASPGTESAPTKAKKPAREVFEASADEPVVASSAVPVPTPLDLSRYPIPENVPSEIAHRLYDLYSAAEQFRHKLRLMDEQPPEKRLGYTMTERLLRNTEEQIARIEAPYRGS